MLNRKLIMIAVFSLLGCFLFFSNLMAEEFTLKYFEDFSNDPNWITNDPSNNYWDSSNGYYHAWMSNTNTSYAVKQIDWTGNSFIMEWDVRINSVQWSAGMTFGIFDNQFLYGTNSIVGDYSLGDGGYARALRVNNGIDDENNYSYSNPWQTGTWYKNIITYNAITGNIIMASYERDSMTLIETLVISMGSFPDGIDYIGLSRLHIEGYTNNAVNLDLDNVYFYEATSPVPEPATMLLLGSGLVVLSSFRRKFKKL